MTTATNVCGVISGVLVLALAIGGVTVYVRAHGRPVEWFDPRRHPTAQLQSWREEFRLGVLDFQNALRDRQVAELVVSDDQVNAALMLDGPFVLAALDINPPGELHDVQVGFVGASLNAASPTPKDQARVDGPANSWVSDGRTADGQIIVRAEYVGPQTPEAVILSVSLRVCGPADAATHAGVGPGGRSSTDNAPGGWRIELAEVRVGHQIIPPAMVARRLRERLDHSSLGAKLTPGDTADGRGGDGRTPQTPQKLGRDLLWRLAHAEPVGPWLELPKLPGSRERLVVRLTAIEAHAGQLRLRLDPRPQ